MIFLLRWLVGFLVGVPFRVDLLSIASLNYKMRFAALIAIVLLIGVAVADTCGGNCPSNDCPAGKCLCGTDRAPTDVAAYCGKFDGWSQECCKCIANAESGGNAHAENYNDNGSFDIGLYQINDVNWNSCSGGKAPCDPETSLECAKKVWSWGSNTWRLWSTCTKCGCCNSH